MNHNFLLKSGRWSVDGYYCARGEQCFPLKGFMTTSWQREYWFKMTIQLSIAQSSPLQILCQSKGHLDNQGKSYTYVLQHSILGNIEGEGWLGMNSIIQHYWVVGATQRRLGFDTFYYLSEDTYHFTSVYLERHNLTNTMEATLKHLI